MIEVNNDQAAAADSPVDLLQLSAESQLNEIDIAGQYAYEDEQAEKNQAMGLAPGGLSVGAGAQAPIPFSKLTEEQKQARIKVFTKRASGQRDKGRAQLEREHAGAMTVPIKLSWNDLTVASSCERFLGMCDLSPYTIGRRGPSVLGSKATKLVLDKLAALVEKYYEAGMLAKRSAQTLFDQEREMVFAEDEWITPEYTTAAFQMTMQAKFRGTARIVAGMAAWDEAIRLANVLEWNGKIETSKIADLREQERKAMYAVFNFARRSLIGLYNGTLKLEGAKPAKEKAAPVQAGAEESKAELAET